MAREFQHRSRAIPNGCESPGRHRFAYLDNVHGAIKIDDVNRKSHAQGVNSTAGDDPRCGVFVVVVVVVVVVLHLVQLRILARGRRGWPDAAADGSGGGPWPGSWSGSGVRSVTTRWFSPVLLGPAGRRGGLRIGVGGLGFRQCRRCGDRRQRLRGRFDQQRRCRARSASRAGSAPRLNDRPENGSKSFVRRGRSEL